jgi:hypothetical protein
MKNSGTNVEFTFFFFKYRMVNPRGKFFDGKFFEPGFPHNFAQNYRHDLKMGCTRVLMRLDAS